MSTQQVYFTNPAQITQLQTLAGTDSVLPSTGIVDIENFILGKAPYTTSTLGAYNMGGNKMTAGFGNNFIFSQDKNGVASKMYNVAYGNVFSGQDFFYTTGAADRSGRIATQDDYFFTASSMKMIGGLLMCKMMEEQYFNIAAPISTYLPYFAGTGYYLISATGTTIIPNLFTAALTTGPATFPNYSDWTGTLGAMNLNEITIAQAVSLQLGHPSYGYQNVGIYKTTTQYNWANNPDQLDFRYNYGHYLACKALDKGVQLGATGACQATDAIRTPFYDFWFNDYSFCTGPYTDNLYTVINTIKSGAVPMYWKPGATLADPISGGEQSLEVYSEFGWLLIGAIMTKQLKARGLYNSIEEYARAKFFTPMDITASFGITEQPNPGNYLETTFRRGPGLCNGFAASGCSPEYAANNVNGLAWVSEYPNDSFYYLTTGYKNVYRPDPEVGPTLVSSLYIKIKDYVKFLKMIANKGVYNNTRIMSRTALKYLFTPCSNSFSSLETVAGLDFNSQNTTWYIGFCGINNPVVSEMTIPTSQQTWAFEIVTTLNFGLSPNVMFWSGISDNSWFLDTDTGNYALAITGQHWNGALVKNAAPYNNIVGVMGKYI